MPRNLNHGTSAATGVLPDTALRTLLEEGAISAAAPVEDSQIQPASLDLRLGHTAIRLRASFLAGPDTAVTDRLADLAMHRIDLADGAVLEKGCVYLVELQERLTLSDDLSAVANAKSSTGRLDLLTRTVTDGGTEFDRIAPGYNGPLYAEICPRSFSVLVRSGMQLNQLRLRRGHATITDEELTTRNGQEPLVYTGEGASHLHIEDGLGFSVDLSAASGNPVGYRAKSHTGVIDLDRLAAYPANEFWDPLDASNGRLILDPGAFYILVSREAVYIPPDCAAEMAPYLALVGEFRVHYAGFFDPGFGAPQAGGAGSRGVLEVRCHESPFVLEHGQRVGRLVYERMSSPPARLYGAELSSNYQGQGLKLAKQFRLGN